MRKLPGVSKGGIGGSLIRRVGAALLSVALAFLGIGGLESSVLANPVSLAGSRPAISLNKTRYPQERALLLAPDQRRSFPRLGDSFEVLAPSTHTYNCISNSLGDYNEWTNPLTAPGSHPLEYMDRLYAKQGFSRASSMNLSLESGKRKIVVYAKTKNGKLAVTHAARQLSDGTWSSKLGSLSLIRHPYASLLEGPDYGRPVAVYVANR